MTDPMLPQTVLVVEDEPMIRMIARVGLTGAGYAITEAANSVESLAALLRTAKPFDVILLDLGLAGEDGAALIPEFRTRTPSTRILVVSGAPQDDLDTDGVLGKPFTRVQLLEAVARVLRPPQN